MPHPPPRVTHCNVATPRPLAVGARVVDTAIDKRAQTGPVEVDGDGFVADQVGNGGVHGGTARALYAFAGEDYDVWAQELERTLRPGLFGENLTTRAIDVNAARIGETWRIGSVTVAVSGPRVPCATFAAHIGVPGWARRFAERDRPGTYLRVLEPGAIQAGDEIVVLSRPPHDVTVSDVARIMRRDRGEAERMVDLPHLIEGMADWARQQVGATT